MSKVDAQRAMREARFAAYRAKVAAAPPATAAPRTVRAPAPVDAPVEPPLESPSDEPAVEASPVPGAELCGHKNMGNKSCKRPAGHAEKSHRYK